MISAQGHISPFLPRWQTVVSLGTSLAVLLEGDILITPVSPEKSTPTQSLPFWTDQTVPMVSKPSLGDHVLLMVWMDGNVRFDSQFFQLFPQPPITIPSIRGQRFR